MRIYKVIQLKEIQIEPNGFVYPKNSSTQIILDKKSPAKNKVHQLIYQKGPQFGSVGDCCAYLNNDDLLALEEKGMIKIKKSKHPELLTNI